MQRDQLSEHEQGRSRSRCQSTNRVVLGHAQYIGLLLTTRNLSSLAEFPLTLLKNRVTTKRAEAILWLRNDELTYDEILAFAHGAELLESRSEDWVDSERQKLRQYVKEWKKSQLAVEQAVDKAIREEPTSASA